MALINKDERVKELSRSALKLKLIRLRFTPIDECFHDGREVVIEKLDMSTETMISIAAIKFDDWHFAIVKLTPIGRDKYYKDRGKEFPQDQGMIVGYHQGIYYKFKPTKIIGDNASNRLMQWFVRRIYPLLK